MSNIYRVEYSVTYIKNRDVIADNEDEAMDKVSEEVSWEKPCDFEIIGSSFIGENNIKFEDLGNLNEIASNMSICSHEYRQSTAAAKHECLRKMMAEKHE